MFFFYGTLNFFVQIFILILCACEKNIWEMHWRKENSSLSGATSNKPAAFSFSVYGLKWWTTMSWLVFWQKPLSYFHSRWTIWMLPAEWLTVVMVVGRPTEWEGMKGQQCRLGKSGVIDTAAFGCGCSWGAGATLCVTQMAVTCKLLYW